MRLAAVPWAWPPALGRRWAALSPERREHSERVAEEMATLARCHGLNPDEALLAGYGHDLARELGDQALRAAAAQLGPAVDADADEWEQPILLHGPVAAAWLQAAGAPPAVVEAVRYHTTGAPALSPLGQALVVADGVEPGRRYAERAAIAALARRDLAAGYAAALGSTVDYLRQRKMPVHPRTLAALAAWARAGSAGG